MSQAVPGHKAPTSSKPAPKKTDNKEFNDIVMKDAATFVAKSSLRVLLRTYTGVHSLSLLPLRISWYSEPSFFEVVGWKHITSPALLGASRKQVEKLKKMSLVTTCHSLTPGGLPIAASFSMTC